MPKAINIDKDEAKQIGYLPPNTVMISINSTYEPLYPLSLDRLSSKVLTVQFDDTTHSTKETRKKVIDTATIYKILDFINLNKGKDFIVHCHAGFSRSAAVCLFLNIVEGYELKKNFWSTSEPNPYVVGRLLIERYKK